MTRFVRLIWACRRRTTRLPYSSVARFRLGGEEIGGVKYSLEVLSSGWEG